jgi:hypothetical protein
MLKKILLATLVAGSLGVSVPSFSAVYVEIAPPPPRVEVVPAPRRGYVWVPGYWDWRHGRHVWVSGAWVRERRGYRYAAPRWVERNGRWYMEQGRWARGDRDHDGIPNRDDRDKDNDGVPNRYDARPNNPYRQ